MFFFFFFKVEYRVLRRNFNKYSWEIREIASLCFLWKRSSKLPVYFSVRIKILLHPNLLSKRNRWAQVWAWCCSPTLQNLQPRGFRGKRTWNGFHFLLKKFCFVYYFSRKQILERFPVGTSWNKSLRWGETRTPSSAQPLVTRIWAPS